MIVDRPHVVLLGLADTGYGMVRSLAANSIPMIAFEKTRRPPEVWTTLCQVRYYENEDDLLEQLKTIPIELGHKPVLFMSSDVLVKFYSDNRVELKDLYRIHYPDSETVDLLLEKTRFSDFATEYGFIIPQTHIIRNTEDLNSCYNVVKFPCIVKPYWREQPWKDARFPKVFFFQRKEDLKSNLPGIFAVEQNLVIQEWIPGSDRDIFFCLTYFDDNHECISSFTGRKLRQWPVGTGSTSCAEPFDEPAVKQETHRLFKSVSFAGFGSVEFKRHSETGIYYIMEPTVGRPNHQSYLAMANGVNIPSEAYSLLTGIKLPSPKSPRFTAVWIDDPVDIFSILVSIVNRQFNLQDFLRTLVRRKSFRFFNLRDPRPFFALWIPVPYKLMRKVFRYIFGHHK